MLQLGYPSCGLILCMNLNGCCKKQIYDVVVGILLFASRCFECFGTFQYIFLMLHVANIDFFFILQTCFIDYS